MSYKKYAALVLASIVVTALAADKPAEPYRNPFMADSAYTVTHSRSDFTSIAGPTGKSRALRADEIKWKALGPVNGFIPLYSGPYPNGKRVIWVGGYDRVAKLDADTLDVLTTYATGGNTYFGEEETERHIQAMDKLDDAAKLAYINKIWAEANPQLPTFYRMLSSENELYLPHRNADRSLSLQVFGEVDAKDPASKIQFRREWKIPAEVSKAGIFGMQITSDGRIIIVTMDGAMIALSRDFKDYNFIRLPNKNTGPEPQDFFQSFVRNSLATDDHGGIFVVTRDHLHRVQWTGEKLSMDEADGAWAAEYPNELGWGSGTTPNLMGWGPQEDHLVVIADGTKGNNMMAFWRDEIPSDWKGIPGMNRRIAGITKVKFGVAKDEQPQIENGLVVYGYGAFIDNSNPIGHLPDLGGGRMVQYLAESWYMHVPGHEPLGGTKIEWNPKTRTLGTAWSTQDNFVSSVCTISSATELLYCWGARNRVWTLEGVDWKTGKSAFTYPLGKSQRYNVFGGPIIVAPNGAVDCGCTGGLGMVRVQPRQAAKPGPMVGK